MSLEGAVRHRTPARWNRLFLLLGIVAYIVCFRWLYHNYLAPEWGYLGFGDDPVPAKYLLLTWLLSLIPALWMPLLLRRPSQLAYWVLYLVVIIPSMFVSIYSHINSFPELATLMLFLFAGFAIVGISYHVPILRLRSLAISKKLFWTTFLCIALALATSLLVVFRHTLTLVSFRDVYDVRFAADDLIENSLINYPLMWLSGAIDPFLVGFGLFYKRPLLTLLGVSGQLLVYASMGTKGSASSIFFILVFYFILRNERRPFGLTLTWGLTGALGVLCSVYLFLGERLGSLFTTVTSLILMRAIGIPGLMTAQYYDFFQRNPLTYYSTVKGINRLVQYPYANPIGNEVGYFYSGDRTYDAITHFWASDGIAALGLPGILIISVVCAITFWIFDSVTYRQNMRFAALVTCYAAYNLCNIPLFTSVLSGGMGVLALTLYFLPAEKNANVDATQVSI